VKRNSSSRWYVSGLGVLLAISMSMLLLVGCSSDNPVVPIADDPPDDPTGGDTNNLDDAMRPDDPKANPPGFDKGGDRDPTGSDEESREIYY
jgi:hypothetical protein